MAVVVLDNNSAGEQAVIAYGDVFAHLKHAIVTDKAIVSDAQRGAFEGG